MKSNKQLKDKIAKMERGYQAILTAISIGGVTAASTLVTISKIARVALEPMDAELEALRVEMSQPAILDQETPPDLYSNLVDPFAPTSEPVPEPEPEQEPDTIPVPKEDDRIKRPSDSTEFKAFMAEYQDRDGFDFDALRTDYDNGNFDITLGTTAININLERYRHTEIVHESIRNGLLHQAREQCRQYDLKFEVEDTNVRSSL